MKDIPRTPPILAFSRGTKADWPLGRGPPPERQSPSIRADEHERREQGMTQRRSKKDWQTIASRLRKPLRPTPPPKETRAELRLRVEARAEAEARLREHRMAEASWEAYEDPDVGRWRNWKAKRAIAEAETRRVTAAGVVGWVGGETVPEPVVEEPSSPAGAALAHFAETAAERQRRRTTWPTWNSEETK